MSGRVSEELGEKILQAFGEEAMVSLGEALGRACNGGAILFMQGQLGAGKTTLTRGILRSVGHTGAVKSPTYTLVEPYDSAGSNKGSNSSDNYQQAVYHFDLYRLGDPEELEYMGIRDYFSKGNLCVIEWPDKGKGFLPSADLEVTIKVIDDTSSEGETGRELSLVAYTPGGEAILASLGNVGDT